MSEDDDYVSVGPKRRFKATFRMHREEAKMKSPYTFPYTFSASFRYRLFYWIYAWCQLIDSITEILTFSFWSPKLSGRWVKFDRCCNWTPEYTLGITRKAYQARKKLEGKNDGIL